MTKCLQAHNVSHLFLPEVDLDIHSLASMTFAKLLIFG
jgi:hypothetical protein